MTRPDDALVERVARAICETLFGPWDAPPAGGHGEYTIQGQSEKAARAAIAAYEAQKTEKP